MSHGFSQGLLLLFSPFSWPKNVCFFLAERGVVWEETIILLPDNVHFVFLSATIPNARQFAEWVAHLHKQVTCFPNNLPILLGLRTTGMISRLLTKTATGRDDWSRRICILFLRTSGLIIFRSTCQKSTVKNIKDGDITYVFHPHLLNSGPSLLPEEGRLNCLET